LVFKKIVTAAVDFDFFEIIKKIQNKQIFCLKITSQGYEISASDTEQS
jgi:hypothetical protein